MVSHAQRFRYFMTNMRNISRACTAESADRERIENVIRLTSLLTGTAVLVALSACGVPKERHKRTLDELAETQNKLRDSQTERKKKTDRVKQLEFELSSTQVERDKKSAADREKEARIATLLEDMKATRAQLLEVKTQQEKSQERLKAFRALNQRFRTLVSAGALDVSFRNGQMVLRLPSEVLFPSGRAELSKQGKEALTRVLDVLGSFRDRRFLIAGHTDNKKIRSGRFKSNWHLSTVRAVSVVQFMIEAGFEPKHLGAAGYGEFDPIAPNDTKENLAKNRRIEIILVPDLSELPNLMDPS